MGEIWLTSDTHFGHENILRYCDRPFGSIEEHDDALISNWNQVVQSGDVVIHLGDFMYRSDRTWGYFLSKLHGDIYLIQGNHDYGLDEAVSAGIKGVYQWWAYPLDKRPKGIFLCHYPMRTWSGLRRGVPHFYGHLHTRPARPFKRHPFTCDVGVDNHAYFPVNLEKLLDMTRKDRDRISPKSIEWGLEDGGSDGGY